MCRGNSPKKNFNDGQALPLTSSGKLQRTLFWSHKATRAERCVDGRFNFGSNWVRPFGRKGKKAQGNDGKKIKYILNDGERYKKPCFPH